MSDTNTLPTSPSRMPRNAILIGGGVALAGLGLAAGLLMRSPSESSSTLPSPVAAATAPATLPATAPNDGPAPEPAAAAQETPKPAPKTTHKPVHTAQAPQQQSAPAHELQTQPAAVCASCGVIEAVRPVTVKGEGTGLGAVGGAVAGGLLGHQMGGGKGKSALTVLGAIGGGLAGNEVEKRARAETVYEVKVRMDDGSLRTFTQKTSPTPGARVTVDGQTLRMTSGNGSNT